VIFESEDFHQKISYSMNIDLKQTNVLLTGASRGIGFAIAKQLLASGAKVILHHNRPSENIHQLEQTYPTQAFGLRADLAEAQAVSQLWQQACEKLGEIHVLINNAGIAIESSMEKEEEAWLNDWERTMQVNLTATAILSRQATQHFIKHQLQGKLIHIASRAAFRGDTTEYMAYAASKAGMVALSHSLARAYGKQGITSFVIAPGFTQTDMAQEFIDKYGKEHALHDILLPNLTQPHDIAPMILLLASGLADHATGTTISINAGSYIR
jgi:NAD(P)-dependent dehydrogenase (short-subunit alcohol dehydrogenase family)